MRLRSRAPANIANCSVNLCRFICSSSIPKRLLTVWTVCIWVRRGHVPGKIIAIIRVPYLPFLSNLKSDTGYFLLISITFFMPPWLEGAEGFNAPWHDMTSYTENKDHQNPGSQSDWSSRSSYLHTSKSINLPIFVGFFFVDGGTELDISRHVNNTRSTFAVFPKYRTPI